MKKNILLNILAIVVILLTTACEKNDIPTNDNKTTISFEVSTPKMATRSFSQGELINKLKYAVYDSDHTLMQRTELQGEAQVISGATKVTLQLAAGKEYYVLFWAAAEGAPYDVNWEQKTMTVDYLETMCNDERGDAFYYYHHIPSTQKSGSVPLTLTRPFAQLNIGTNDLSEATGNRTNIDCTQVKVNAYNTLNFVDGSATGISYVTFALNTRPDTSRTFPVDGYKYLTMNYILVGTNEVKSDVELFYAAENGNNLQQRTFSNVPLQRNHRTNIYGALLSNSSSSISVTPPNP